DHERPHAVHLCTAAMWVAYSAPACRPLWGLFQSPRRLMDLRWTSPAGSVALPRITLAVMKQRLAVLPGSRAPSTKDIQTLSQTLGELSPSSREGALDALRVFSRPMKNHTCGGLR